VARCGIARPVSCWNGEVAATRLEVIMRRMVLSACLVIIAAASTARAQECDRDDDSQQMMNICAAADHAAADATLNKTYQDIVGQGDAKTNKLLQAAQRAWIAFRDAECDYSTSDSVGGSIHPMELSQCLTRLTNDRIKQLTADTNCEEGDVSCASPDEDESDDMQ
jgi:uncharacterized protein YecT (DUF1311 family)